MGAQSNLGLYAIIYIFTKELLFLRLSCTLSDNVSIASYCKGSRAVSRGDSLDNNSIVVTGLQETFHPCCDEGSVGCKVFKRGVNSPITSAKTLCRQQSVAMSSGSTGKTLSCADCCNSTVISIYDNLLSLGSHQVGQSKLKNVDLASFSHQKLNYLPTRYKGDVVYELPLFPMSKAVELQCWRAWIGGEMDMLGLRRLLRILLIRMGSSRLGT